jgi:hypothetical protein
MMHSLRLPRSSTLIWLRGPAYRLPCDLILKYNAWIPDRCVCVAISFSYVIKTFWDAVKIGGVVWKEEHDNAVLERV